MTANADVAPDQPPGAVPADRVRAMRILVADANADGLDAVELLLQEAGYTSVTGIRDPDAVGGICSSWRPDLVILDLAGTRGDAWHVLARLRPLLREPEMLPVLVISTTAGPDAVRRALSLGAREIVVGPLDQRALLLHVRHLLRERLMELDLREHNQQLEIVIGERTGDLIKSRAESLLVLARAAEYHDDTTGRHSQRVGRTAGLIAVELGVSRQGAALICDAAPLHDLGKVGISEHILRKPGPLTDAEWRTMMRHVEIGAQILDGMHSPVLRTAAEIARYHHERWDGTGYLAGLRHEQIPLAARITAVADVFDALTHARPDRPAWEPHQAAAHIAHEAGGRFDPQVVSAFARLNLCDLIADARAACPGQATPELSNNRSLAQPDVAQTEP